MNTIDLSFQPDTYWPASLTPEQLLSRIRGKVRQDMAREAYETFGFTALNEFLVKEELEGEEREAWAAQGPGCLGGEFLPVLEPGEVEIARLSLLSVTSDQISVRARQVNATIHYRIVGEYEDEEGMRLQLPFDTSEQPLSLGQLMDLIEGACVLDPLYPGGIFTSHWEMHYESSADEDIAVSFFSLSSPFYREIHASYQSLAQKWVEGKQR